MSATTRSGTPRLSQAISVWGLLVLLVVLIAVFSALRPETFPTYFNFRSIMNNRAISALLALAVFLPMTANHFDLSVGFLLGIAQVLVIGLQGQGLNWPEAAAVVLLLGAFVGLCNGMLVTVVGIDSFIATLGTGTLLYGFNEWYTGGQQVVASLPQSFIDLSGTVFGIPLPAIYVLVLSLVLWIVFEFLPAGRHLYVLGANARAAELNGISAKRYVTLAFVGAGVTAAFAGIVLQSQLQVGQSSVGQEYLLPAFTAALLGATSIRPGRVNVWGTILAVAVLAVTVAGLNQLGAPFFVEPIFDGAMLILAVGLAVTAAKRRVKLSAAKPDVPASP
ncbi:ABC transporter permease [Acidisoma cladoniae]|jgi:ribose transport system permease protein|uniref:ABC transporter permease n=1 Tax=Acidisoma cladoniae TaxID=3040935 RepID=UPI00254FDBFD|nr:ABC transporter permease [Acidisoma sp. PAMC 29798]